MLLEAEKDFLCSNTRLAILESSLPRVEPRLFAMEILETSKRGEEFCVAKSMKLIWGAGCRRHDEAQAYTNTLDMLETHLAAILEEK